MKRFIILIVLLSIANPSWANFRIGISEENLKIAAYIIDDVKELYERAGISNASLEVMPGARLIGLASEQRLDSLEARLKSAFQDSPYIAVDEPIYLELNYFAFKLADSNIVVNSLDDLAEYRVVAERHVKRFQDLAQTNKNITLAPSVSSIYQMLQANRVDLILLTDFEHSRYVSSGVIAEGKIIPAGPPLASEWLYHFVHQRHADKVGLLEKLIKEMKTEGKFLIR